MYRYYNPNPLGKQVGDYVSNEYLIHYNHNHDKEGKFTFSKGGSAIKGAASSVGSALLKKKKNKLPDAEILSKKGGSKSDNTKLGKDEKARLMNSGSLEEINTNKDRLSNKELEFAINRIQKDKNDRINLEKRLSELNGPEAQTKIEKGAAVVEQAVKTGMTMKDLTEKGMTAWNFMAKIHNLRALPDDKWFTFDEQGNPQSNSAPVDVIDLVTKGSISDILKNKDNLTKEQLQEAIDRRNKIDTLEKMDPNIRKEKGVLSDKEKDDIIKKGDFDSYQKNSDQFTPGETKKILDNYDTRTANDKRVKDIEYEKKKNSINVTPYDPSNAPPSQIYPEQKPKKQGLFSKAKDAINESINSYKPVDRNAYEQKLNQYEKEARSDAQSYRENSSSNNENSGRSSSTVDTSRNYETSRSTFNYEPSDTVRDFFDLYANKHIPTGSNADKVVKLANVGYDIYKNSKENNKATPTPTPTHQYLKPIGPNTAETQAVSPWAPRPKYERLDSEPTDEELRRRWSQRYYARPSRY